MKSNKKVDFEAQLERLEEICEKLRSPDTKLAEAGKYFEEGMALSQALEKELTEIEGKVERLMKQSPLGDENEATVQTFSKQGNTESYLELFNNENTLDADD